jgi:hypothetical protein
MARIRAKLTYANVVATLALIVALGIGTAWAGTHLSKNSVKSKQIKDGAVQNMDLAADAVTSEKVKDGSLLGADFAAGQLPAGATGPQGPQGEQGLQGIQGPAGPTLGVSYGATPPAAEYLSLSFERVEIDMPVGGRLFATANSQSLGTVCNPSGNADIGLYVDGSSASPGSATPIPGTDRRRGTGVPPNYDASGVSPSLSAGHHTVSLGIACDGASTPVGFSSPGQDSLQAIMLGG